RGAVGNRLELLVGEGDADVADRRAGLAQGVDRGPRPSRQRVGILDPIEDPRLVVHHQQGGALRVQLRGVGVAHQGSPWESMVWGMSGEAWTIGPPPRCQDAAAAIAASTAATPK